MYGLKTPRYKGTCAKTTASKPLVSFKEKPYHITSSSVKVYIAKSISDEVTHEIVGSVGNMTHDIMKSTLVRRGRNVTGRTRTNRIKYW